MGPQDLSCFARGLSHGSFTARAGHAEDVGAHHSFKDHPSCAKRLAQCQLTGTGPSTGGLLGGGPLGTRYPELLHAKLKRRALDAEPGSRPMGACENPIGLLQHQ